MQQHKKINICIMGVLGGESEKEPKRLLEETMEKISPNLRKTMDVQI